MKKISLLIVVSLTTLALISAVNFSLKEKGAHSGQLRFAGPSIAPISAEEADSLMKHVGYQNRLPIE